MPITSQEDFQQAKELLESGKAKDPARVKSAISTYLETTNKQGNNGPSFLGWDPGQGSGAKPGDIVATGARSKPNAQGYDIDLSRPDAVVLQPGETAGSLRLQTLRKQFEDRKLPNASKLKVYSDPPEYEPPPKPQSPFNPMSALSAQSYLGPDDATHGKYFHEPTVAEFRNDVAKSPELQARLAKDFPHISDKLKAKVDDNQLTSSDTFLAYQDSRWRLAYADAVKRGAPLYRLAYTTKIPDSEKAAADRADMANALVGGVGQGALPGLLGPLQQGLNPRMAEEGRAERQRNPGSAFVGDAIGSMLGAPRLLFGGLSKLKPIQKLGDVNKYLPGAAAGALTGAGDDAARQVGESVAESLDAHDAALEALARIHDRFDPMRMATAGALGGGLSVAGEGAADLAHTLGRKILTSVPGREVVARNLGSGGRMTGAGGIKLEPELEALRSDAAVAGKNADKMLAGQLVDPVASSQLRKGEQIAREGVADTALARESARKSPPRVVDGSVSHGGRRSTAAVAERIRQIADDIPNFVPQDQAKKTAINQMADNIASMRAATPEQLDAMMARIDKLAKTSLPNSNHDVDYKQVTRLLRDFRDEFSLASDDATVADVPEFTVRDALGDNKVVGGYSGSKIRQRARMDVLENENKALGFPEGKIPSTGVQKLPKAPGPDELQALADSTSPRMTDDPNLKEAVADRIHSSAADPNKILDATDKITRAIEDAGGNAQRTYSTIRKLKDRGDYENMLGQAVNGISIGPGGLGNKFLNANNLIRLVPSLKGLAGHRPTPPRFEPTSRLRQAIEEFMNRKEPEDFGLAQKAVGTVRDFLNPEEVAFSKGKTTMTNPKRTGDEVMSEMVPELGGGLFKLGGSKFPSAAASAGRKGKERSVLQKLTPQEQKLLVEIIGNLAEMTPETP